MGFCMEIAVSSSTFFFFLHACLEEQVLTKNSDTHWTDSPVVGYALGDYPFHHLIAKTPSLSLWVQLSLCDLGLLTV